MEGKKYLTKISAMLICLILILQIIIPTIVSAVEASTEYFKIKETNLTVSAFKEKYGKKISEAENINIYKENIKASETDFVTTGMTIHIANNNSILYTIVVRGDINCDGKLSATDLSQMRLNETGLEELEGARLAATDINYDGKTTVLDRSQLRMLLVGLELPQDSTNISGEIKIVPSVTEPAKEVTIKVEWPQNAETLTKQISIDGGKTFTTYSTEVVVKENTTIVARLIDGQNKVIASASLQLTNIDNKAPEKFELTAIHKIANYITLSGTAIDKESGIGGYYYSYDDGETWLPKTGTENNSYTFTNIPAATTVNLRMKAEDKVGNEVITEAVSKRTFSRGIDILKKKLSAGIEINEELQTITLPDGRAYRLVITEDGGYKIVSIGGKSSIATQEDHEKELKAVIKNIEKDGPKTVTEILETVKEQGLGEISAADNTLMIELTTEYIFYKVAEDENGTHKFVFVDRILKNGLTASGQNIEQEVVDNMQELLNEMSQQENFTIAGYLQEGVNQGYVLAENINKTQGTFEVQIENGPVYKVVKDEDQYIVELIGLAEEIHNGFMAQKIEEELVRGLKEEMLDWAIADGITTEQKVDREAGTYETNEGQYKKAVIELEEGNYKTEDTTKTEGAKITYTEKPQFPTITNIVELEVKAEYEKGIAKIEIISEIGETLEEKKYTDNRTNITESFNITSNGQYKIKVTTTDGKETEKTVFIAQVGNLLPIGVTIEPEEPRNTTKIGTQNGKETGPITVTIKYSENVAFNNEDRYQYQIGTTEGTWQTATRLQRIEGITENCTIYARYWDGTNSIKQISNIPLDIHLMVNLHMKQMWHQMNLHMKQ